VSWIDADNALTAFLFQHGLMLVTGVSALLGLGSLGVSWQRSPSSRQRVAEMTLAGALAWLGLACIPLPRPGALWLGAGPPGRNEATGAPTPARAVLELLPGDDAILAELPLVPLVAVNSKVPKATWAQPPAWRDRQDGRERLEGGTAAAQAFRLPEPGNDEIWRGSRSALESEMAPHPSSRSLWPSWPLASALRLLAWLYLAGAFACLAWLLAGWLMLRRLERSASAPPGWLDALFSSLAEVGGARAKLIVTSRAVPPMSWGGLRPRIVLPETACRLEQTDQLRQVLLHEVGHIRRRDARGNLLFNLALPLLYFHPLFWWLRSRARLAAELVADDWAASHSSRESYVEELIAFVRAGKRPRAPALGTLAIFENPTQFYRRMHMLLRREGRLATRCSLRWRLVCFATFGLAVGLAALVAGVQPIRAQAPPPKEDADDETANRLKTPSSEEERDSLEKEIEDLNEELAKLREQINDLNTARGRGRGEGDAPGTRGPNRPSVRGPSTGAPTPGAGAYPGPQPGGAMKSSHRWPPFPSPSASPAPAPGARGLSQSLPPATPQDAASEWPLNAVIRGLAGGGTLGSPPRDDAGLDPDLAGSSGRATIAGLQIDLVTLATTYADAVASHELSTAKLESVQKLRTENLRSEEELAVARINVTAADRKVRLLRAIAEAARDAAKQETELVQKGISEGTIPRSRLAPLAASLRIIELILDAPVEPSTSMKAQGQPRIALPADGSTLTIGGDLVIALKKDGRTLTATEISTGRTLWEAVVSRVKLVEPTLHLDGDKLTVSDSQGQLIVVDRQNGKVLFYISREGRESRTPEKP
jgi:beta-lactamase regulating signal transducer with metallopeptidase domain